MKIPEPDGELSYENITKLLANSDWPLATTEVADAFDITQQSAHYRLTELHRRAEIERRKSAGTVYWRVQDS
ncbi:FaeA/PapI family transcriptional regulator (plasmid) [Haloarcula marismortui]|uniref:FaeA/PapI family transcriptional regulator n=1 Tax=Haloarcula marismortui TaxID=2238 RepID=UPI003C77366F